MFSVIINTIHAQFVTVSGVVYDITARNPLEAVAVLSKSGRGTITDSLGRYSLTVLAKDSIWFSLINKSTRKYAVDTITNLSGFDVSIHVKAAELPTVTVRNSNYKLDSIQNRKDYQKYFDFQKPGIRLTRANGYNPSGGVTVGLDLNEFINMFRFRRNRNLQFLQDRLIQQEQDKYINYRFNKVFVRKITKLQSPEIDTFIKYYRPDYEFLKTINELELGVYIQECFKMYKSKKYKNSLRRRED
ncbi:MAG: hypothetical protein ACOVNY_13025 [Chitinophagaceae bacterium]